MKKLLLICCFLLAASPILADSVQVPELFNFNQNSGNIGEVVSFTQGPGTLILSGWLAPDVRGAMWMKNDALDEIGVGLAAEPNHEISGSMFVQVNLSRILALNPTSITFTMNSIQPGENYSIFGSDVSGEPGTLLASNIDSPDFTVPTNFDFISVGSGDFGNVLLNDVSVGFATATPEPSSAVLLFSGLFLGFLFLKVKTCRNSSSGIPWN